MKYYLWRWRLKLVLTLTLCIWLPCFCDIATQTDWSGGDGVTGPVLNWTDVFDSSIEIDWFVEGQIRLAQEPASQPIEHEVQESYCESGLFVADVNNDGYDDVISCSGYDSTIVWWQVAQSDVILWTPHIIDDSISNTQNVIAADIDGDMDLDVIAGGYFIDHLYWWENVDGSGEVWTTHTMSETSGIMGICSADFNADEFNDILGVRGVDGEMLWLENPGNTDSLWIQHIIGTYSNPVSTYADDMENDGDMDALVAAGGVYWWENTDGIGDVWTEHDLDAVGFYGAR
ncbi:MAG: hypothetical protein GF388_09135, partial [Candidatus Aegiribacteria sp.]|nr:hypothetical protein [Candidatus Aegiribacteria sp.]MBD3295225.1 hypothetical protein [Candidatus Fermentibacteria bacterium]